MSARQETRRADRGASNPLPVIHKCFLSKFCGVGWRGDYLCRMGEIRKMAISRKSGVRKDTSETPGFPLGCPPAPPQHPGLLGVLAQLAGPSAWGRDWSSERMGKQGPGNRWEGGGLLSPERKGRKAVVHRKGVCRVPELPPSPRFL